MSKLKTKWIEDSAVTTAKIADSSVSNNKLLHDNDQLITDVTYDLANATSTFVQLGASTTDLNIDCNTITKQRQYVIRNTDSNSNINLTNGVYHGYASRSGLAETTTKRILLPWQTMIISVDADTNTQSLLITSGEADLNTFNNTPSGTTATNVQDAIDEVIDSGLNLSSDGVIDNSADSIAFIDANDSNKNKKESVTTFVSNMAGTGLSAGTGTLAVDLDEVTAGTTMEATDSVVYIDGGITKKLTRNVLTTQINGTGIDGSGGTLSVDLNGVTGAVIDPAADSIPFIDSNDSNVTKKETVADFTTAIAGDGLISTSGVLSREQVYGSIYVTDNVTETTVTVQNTWYQFTGFDTVGVDEGDVTCSSANDDITIGTTGGYRLSCAVSFSGSPNDVIEVAIYKNNGATLVDGLVVKRKLSSGGDVGAAFVGGVASLTANDTIEVWLRNTSDTDNVLVENCKLSICKI